MPPTLPRGIDQKLGLVRALVLILGALLSGGACKHVVQEKPVQPGPPIPAETRAAIDSLATAGRAPSPFCTNGPAARAAAGDT